MNYVEIDNTIDRIPEYDPEKREHFWIVINSFHWVPDSEGRTILDHENLVSVSGPGCYYCMRQYNEFIAMQRCSGDAD